MINNGCFEPNLDQVKWRELDGDVVLVDLETAQIKLLEGSAAILWRALADGVDEDTLAECLCREYQIAPDVARSDAGAFLRELIDRGYVRMPTVSGEHR